MKHTGPTPDQPNRPEHVDITEDDATGDLCEPTEEDLQRIQEGIERKKKERIASPSITRESMLSLRDLAQTSHETAKSKGWWDDERSFAGLTQLMLSELSEALEDYRANRDVTEILYQSSDKQNSSSPVDKPCGVPTELADFIIRVADFCGRYALRLDKADVTTPDGFESGLAEASVYISRAYEALKACELDPKWNYGAKGKEVSWYLSAAVQHIFNMAETLGIDLNKAIEIKAAFNKTRPTRHGGKKI